MSINRQTLKFYWHEIRKHKTSFWAMVVCVPLAGLLLDTLLPYFLTQAVGTFTSNNTELMWQLLTVAAVVALVGVGLNFLGFQSAVYHQARVRNDLTQTTLRDILAKDNAFFSSQKIGALTGKFIDFINAHDGLQDLVVVRTLIFTLNMVVGITLIFMHSWVLGWIVLGLIVGLLIGIRVSLRLRQPLPAANPNLISRTSCFGNSRFTMRRMPIRSFLIRQTMFVQASIQAISCSGSNPFSLAASPNLRRQLNRNPR